MDCEIVYSSRVGHVGWGDCGRMANGHPLLRVAAGGGSWDAARGGASHRPTCAVSDFGAGDSPGAVADRFAPGGGGDGGGDRQVWPMLFFGGVRLSPFRAYAPG